MTYSFDLDAITGSRVNIRLFRNVKNTIELRKKLQSGQLKCCIINPRLIVDPFQIVVAANKALINADNLTTKTVFTEILFNLSISKNITKSLQKFGMDSDCCEQNLLVITISLTTDDNNKPAEDVATEIEGVEGELSELHNLRDLTAIRQTYKIGDVETGKTTLLDSVISRIATKDFVSH